MFVIPLALFLLAKGRGYYLAPAYPILYAAGAVWGEEWLSRQSRNARFAVGTLAWVAIFVNIALMSAFFLPIAPVNSRWWNAAVKINGDFREEIGWPELVETVARIRDSLPPNERGRVRILAANYGEAGAVNLYGPRYGLAPTICPVNSFWERGYGDPSPEILIVLGVSRQSLEGKFDSCELAGHSTNGYGVPNEETTDHPDIFVCRHLRGSWSEVWKKIRGFG